MKTKLCDLIFSLLYALASCTAREYIYRLFLELLRQPDCEGPEVFLR
jgi:hypothetical protein